MAAALALAILGSRNNTLPNSDEIYHLLAARSWIETGTYQVGNGVYERGFLFTSYLGLGSTILGHSLFAATLMTGALFAAYIGIVFLTLTRRIGTGPALTCAVLLMLAPHSLELGSTVRFYAPQAMFVWLGAWASYNAVLGVRRRALWGTLAVGWLVLAYVLQPATAIAAAAIGVWAAITIGDRLIRRGFSITLLASLAVSAIALGFVMLPVEDLWRTYRFVHPWNEGSDVRYYYWVMTEHYNPFWALFPAFTLLAWYREPRIAGFAAIMFAIPFLLHSFGGTREDRYLYYAFPFFFLVAALGMKVLYDLLMQSATALQHHVPALSTRASTRLVFILSLAALTFLGASNLGYITSMKNVAAGSTKRQQPRWDLLIAEHGPALREAATIITNQPNYVLYFLDRVPVGLSGVGPEFVSDYRHGAISISRPESLELVIDCSPQGYLIAEERQWLRNANTGVTKDTARVIEVRMEQVEVPEDWGIKLYRWSHEPHRIPSASCPALG